MYEGESPCIISQAYIVFEVIDETELLPEYLMMWFRRPEFDRYARFKSHGSAREVFEWSEMCEILLQVPSIDEQRKVVAEYQAIERRIENNRRLIATLEETAKTIYRKMFVDDIDVENLPKGWRMGKLKDIATFAYGKMPKEKAKAIFPYLVVMVLLDIVQLHYIQNCILLLLQEVILALEELYVRLSSFI